MRELEPLGLPPDAALASVGHVAFAGGRPVSLDAEATVVHTIPRRELGRHQLGWACAAGADLGSHLGVLLQHQDLAPGFGEDLRRAEPGRARTDDQVLNDFHASSSRMRAAASARAAVGGLGAAPHFRSRLRPRR